MKPVLTHKLQWHETFTTVIHMHQTSDKCHNIQNDWKQPSYIYQMHSKINGSFAGLED